MDNWWDADKVDGGDDNWWAADALAEKQEPAPAQKEPAPDAFEREAPKKKSWSDAMREVDEKIPPKAKGFRSVLEDAAPPPQLPTTSKAPVRPEVRAALGAAWDASSEQGRALMENKNDWTGQLAREREGTFERADEDALRTPSGKKMDTRYEARRDRLAGDGEQPAFAERAAREGAAKGVAAGQEIKALGGTVQESKYDFDTRELFDPKESRNGLNNAVVRGVAKGGLGVAKAAVGYGEFLSDMYGLDSAASQMRDAGGAVRTKEDAIGDRGTTLERNFEGAVSSIAQQLPLWLTGGNGIALGGMILQSFGQEYSDGRAKGQSMADATERSALFAAFEGIGEKFGLKTNISAIKSLMAGETNVAVKAFLTNTLKRELPGEILTTTGQFVTDKYGRDGVALNPKATTADYLDQVKDTVIQTVMQGGIMAGGSKAAGVAVNAVNDAANRRLENDPAKALAAALNSGQFSQAGIDAEVSDALRTQAGSSQAINPNATFVPAPAAPPTPEQRAAEVAAATETAKTAVEQTQQAAVEDIGRQDSVEGAIAATQRAVQLDTKGMLAQALAAAGISQIEAQPIPAAIDQGEANASANGATAPRLPEVGGSIGDVAGRSDGTAGAVPVATAGRAESDSRSLATGNGKLGAPPDAGRANGNAALTQPATAIWTGRRGDGYATEADAARAMSERNRLRPTYDWTTSQNAEGRFVLVGQRKQESAAIKSEAEPIQTGGSGLQADGPTKQVVLQNRDRSTAASIAQMNAIAAKPDYLRAGQSRTMDQGAPVVFGDTPTGAALGRVETVVDGRGDRISTRYAVVDAADLITSHFADGTTNADYIDGMPGKLRAVAGNGRAAGVIEGYVRGTTGTYRSEMEQDAQSLSIDPAAMQAMRQPVLVRVMAEKDVSADIGDRSNTVATARLSPVEEAANDGKRIDLSGMQFKDNGDPAQQSVMGFIQTMPESERGNMLNADGTPTRQAVDRLMAAVFKQAYGSDALVQLYAQATDPEARTVMNALAQAAGPMSQLANTGEFDLRASVAEAAGMAVNAVRKGLKLSDVVRNVDLDTSPETYIVAEFMAQNIRSAKSIGAGLSNMAQKALEQVGIALDNAQQAGMFGEQPTMSRSELLNLLKENDGQEKTPATQQRRPGSDAQLAEPEGAGSSAEAGRSADRAERSQGSGEQAGQGFGLEAPSRAEVVARQDELESAAKQKAKDDAKAEADTKKARDSKDIAARQDASAENFALGQDANDALSGQGAMFSRAPKPDQTDTHAFRKWFGDSVVTVDGKAGSAPLVVYHGTTADFNSFEDEFAGDNFGRDKEGFFFTGSAVEASGYADTNSQFLAAGLSDPRKPAPKAGANVMPVYLSIKNPLTLEKYTWAISSTPQAEIDGQGISLIDFFDGTNGAATAYAKENGYDGLLLQHKGKTLAVAFRPEQIKSATGNRGTFDAGNADIRFSRGAGRFTAIAVPKQTVVWLGFDGPVSLRADLQALANRHSEYYDASSDVARDIAFVMEQPDNWYIHDGAKVMLFREGDNNQIPQVRVELERSGADFVVRSVYVGDRRQIAKKMADKREVLDGIGLGGQSLDSLSVSDYLSAVGDRSSRPESSSDNSPDAQVDGTSGAHSSQAATSRGRTSSMATNDVVGNQGGRSADDSTTGASDAQAVDENTGLPLNADGTVTVYHHTSAASADLIRKTGRLKADAEPDVYVTTRKETDTGYGDSAVALRVRPEQLSIDDEFPDGRKDFRMTVGRPGGSIKVAVENEPNAPVGPDVSAPSDTAIQQIMEAARLVRDSTGIADRYATKDSVRAAVREMVNGFGMLPNKLGRVVVATSDEIKQEWEPLIGPVAMDSEDAGQAQGFYDPASRTVFLIADNIRQGDEMGVVAHELMHKHGQAILGRDGWSKLHGAIEGWASAPAGSQERKVYDEAARRVRESRPGDADVQKYSSQELFPYAAQVALEMEIRPDSAKPISTVAGWLAHVRGALSRVWAKLSTKPGTFDTQDLVNLAFGIAQRENPALGDKLDGVGKGGANYALAELGQTDDLFALPKSSADTVDGIAGDHDQEITVRSTRFPGNETMYTLNMPQGRGVARITVRASTADSVYEARDMGDNSYDWVTGRPGENPEDVPAGTEDVWLDVSQLKPGQDGAVAYSIASTFAHNTGRIFIGDPNGLSKVALRRRLEQMISSALKFGTTAHLAPHPDQVRGGSGVPPLRWVYGDDVGNVERMIAVSVKALDNAFPTANEISYEPARGFYRTDTGAPMSREKLADMARQSIGRGQGVAGSASPAGQAGWRTIARHALFEYLQRSTGAEGNQPGRDGGRVLDGLGQERARLLGGGSPEGTGSPPGRNKRIFYSRRSNAGQGVGGQAAGFDLPAETFWLQKSRRMQDYFIRMQTVQKAVANQGGAVGEQTDVYLAEELSHGRTAALIQQFADERVQPLMEKLVASDIEMDELSLYAYAMHAPERNAQIASINPSLPDGGSGMTDQESQDILDAVQRSGKQAQFHELHRDLMAMTRGNRLAMLADDLITPDEFDALESAYEHYIPLRGFEQLDENNRPAKSAGKGFNVRGKETLRALGRKSRAGQLVENVIGDYQRMVVRGERNHVAKVFLNFVLQNPDANLWEIDATKTRQSLDRQTGRVARSTDIEKGEDTIAVKVQGREIYIQIKDELLARAMRKAHTDETGETERFLIRTVGLYTSLLRNTLTRYNPEFAVVNAARDFGFGSAAVLDKLGEKGVAKFVAHYAGAAMAASRNERKTQDPTNKEWDRWFNEYKAAGGMTSGFYQKSLEEIGADIRGMMIQAGAAPKNSTERMQHNAVTRGVKSALRVLEYAGSVSENAARVAAYRTAREMGKRPAEAASIAKNLTTNFDRKGELGQLTNAFYVFYNAAVQGTHRTVQMLANPKVRKYMAAVTAASVGIALASAIAGGDDPDDGMAYWDKIPDYVKERNLIIMLPPGEQVEGSERVGSKGRYLTIPLQYGLNLFPYLGYQIADFVRHQQDPTRGASFVKVSINMGSALMGSFNPFGGSVDVTIGSSVAQAIAPSLMDPVIQFSSGTNGFGRDVAPFKSPFDTKPDSQNSNIRQAGGPAEHVAQWINAATGGSAQESGGIDISAGTVENVVRNLTGGAGMFLYDTLALAGKSLDAMRGDSPDLSPRDIPIGRRLYGEIGGDVDQGLFYDRRREIQEAAGVDKRMDEAGLEMTDPKKVALSSLNKDAGKTTKWLSDIRKEMAEIKRDKSIAKGDKQLKLQKLKAERDRLTAEFNKDFMDVMREAEKDSRADE